MDRPYENLVDLCINTAMASLRGMSNDQLEQILNDGRRIDSIIDSLPQVRSLPSEREVGLTENKTLAEWNLGQEERIEKLRAEVLRNYEKASNLKAEVEEMKARLDSSAGNQSLDVTSNLLQVAAQEADDEAEALTRDLYNGTVNIEQFLQQFHDKKTLAHSRKIKCDRLMNILREQQFAQPSPHRISMPTPTYAPAAAPRHNFF